MVVVAPFLDAIASVGLHMFVPVFDDGISSCNMSRAPGPGQARTESPDWTIANTIASRQKACETTPAGCSKYFVERIVVWRKGLGQKLSDSDCPGFAPAHS